MKTIELKVARIGNSRGIRLPAESLRRYRIGQVILMEERSDGILLRTAVPAVEKLSWEDTARDMADNREDWKDWDSTIADGLDKIPWKTDMVGRVAERKAQYGAKLPKGKH